jgi:hypothetical protein
MTTPPAPITADMSIPEIVAQYPRTQEVFLRHGVQVDGYRALEHENLFATSRVHQWNLPEILAELNQVVR